MSVLRGARLRTHDSRTKRAYSLTYVAHTQNIKEGLEGRPASWYSDVYDLAFSDLDKARATKLWENELKEADKREEKKRGED